ncbi:LutC/YkgG family protein [Gracilibacillus alcaliphilus]|uniref:LutC/YkgG family protein n=1 Tax=Gracilibacillus alcaliphilus TaxID=1401441 RepID=UPI00195C983B|nr:lactate utilization protein C [Gracilibacillus alcaliphilus]MBM7676523.1 L-lactate dehydrogenase complex protein LldG [Gracilibacillus alcaliphilus]
MAIHNRDKFLNKLAANLGRPQRREGVSRPEYTVQPQHRVFKDYSTEDLIAVLQEHCKVIHTDFVRTSKEELTTRLREVLDKYEARSLIASNDKRNQEYGLDLAYQQFAEEIDVHIWDASIGKENQVIAERTDVGISFSDITLAESGTVTLMMNKDNGRSISLMPKCYIAIIPKETIVPRMTQAAQKIHANHQEGIEPPSSVCFVTGPSNSADIEMNLIVGVHGPVKVTYIVVD